MIGSKRAFNARNARNARSLDDFFMFERLRQSERGGRMRWFTTGVNYLKQEIERETIAQG
jgi:hypothetical protein